jgi:hypothetical protein
MNARNKKLCLIVLPLAGLALFVDRVILSGETDPVAEASAAVAGTAPIAALAKVAHVEAVLIPELPFPRDLPVLPTAGMARDWFQPPELALSEKADALARSGERAASEKDSRSDQERFEAENTLSGIVAVGDVRLAIVNGARKRVGDAVGDCIVIRIEGRVVWFDCAGTTVRLSLFDDSKRQGN